MAHPLLLGRTLSTRHCLRKGLEIQVSVSQARCSSRTSCPCSKQLCERQGDWRMSGVDLRGLPLGYATKLMFYKGRHAQAEGRAESLRTEGLSFRRPWQGRHGAKDGASAREGDVATLRSDEATAGAGTWPSPPAPQEALSNICFAPGAFGVRFVLGDAETCHASGECWARTGAASSGRPRSPGAENTVEKTPA